MHLDISKDGQLIWKKPSVLYIELAQLLFEGLLFEAKQSLMEGRSVLLLLLGFCSPCSPASPWTTLLGVIWLMSFTQVGIDGSYLKQKLLARN